MLKQIGFLLLKELKGLEGRASGQSFAVQVSFLFGAEGGTGNTGLELDSVLECRARVSVSTGMMPLGYLQYLRS